MGNTSFCDCCRPDDMLQPLEVRMYRTVINNHPACFQYLLDQCQMDINITHYNNSALHWAVIDNNLDLVIWLTSQGSDINLHNGAQHTPLHLAVLHNNLSIVTHLLRVGADYNLTYYGCTPFHTAASLGYNDCIQLLLDHGASINDKTFNGSTALHLAATAGKLDTVQFLLDHGADPEIRNDADLTALCCALISSDINQDVIDCLSNYNILEIKEPGDDHS